MRAGGRSGVRAIWNVLLLPLGFGAWVAIWYALFRLVWAFHITVYPEHQLADFWVRGISTTAFALSFMMAFALLPGAMALGFMVGNLLLWLVPPARRALDDETRFYRRADFIHSMQGLAKIGAWALPIGVSIAATAAYFLASLQ
jgi:hypothetical protein